MSRVMREIIICVIMSIVGILITWGLVSYDYTIHNDNPYDMKVLQWSSE